MAVSVWRDEAHGRFKGNAHEDDEEIEDADKVDGAHVEHSNPILPPLSLQPSTDPSRATANAESNSRETRTVRMQDIDGDDEAFWRSLENMAGDTSQKASTSGISATNSSMDQDQEMWDIVNEFEKESEAPSAVAHIPPPTISEPPDRPFDPGDDWDDMYL